jgi:hypothetical protein
VGKSLLAIILVAAAGCTDPVSPPPGAVPLDPPPAFRVAWQQVETCSGLSGAFDRVRWFLVPQPTWRCGDGNCTGLWHAPHDIYLSEIAVTDSSSGYITVRHEILHDLLGGGSDHPVVFGTCHLLNWV